MPEPYNLTNELLRRIEQRIEGLHDEMTGGHSSIRRELRVQAQSLTALEKHVEGVSRNLHTVVELLGTLDRRVEVLELSSDGA